MSSLETVSVICLIFFSSVNAWIARPTRSNQRGKPSSFATALCVLLMGLYLLWMRCSQSLYGAVPSLFPMYLLIAVFAAAWIWEFRVFRRDGGRAGNRAGR
jgi:hypothetical protein